jgi:hypothetical protein
MGAGAGAGGKTTTVDEPRNQQKERGFIAQRKKSADFPYNNNHS